MYKHADKPDIAQVDSFQPIRVSCPAIVIQLKEKLG